MSFWNWMVHDADSSNNFGNWLDFVVGGVTWITNDKWSRCGVLTTSNTCNFTFLIKGNLVDLGIKHISTTMNSAKSRECFRDTSQTIDWV
jgi:hypothetical protein